MILSHPVLFTIALSLTVITTLILWRRQRRFWLTTLGLFLIGTAAGGPIVSLHPAKHITVMVDLSPSTRGAAFRDRSWVVRRIGELAGNLPVQVVAFSDHVEPLPTTDALPDLPCEQTHYEPPSADAIILFSDGRFSMPDANAPTYPVIDPQLIDPPDAAVTEMHFDGNAVVAAVRNTGGNRTLVWSGTANTGSTLVGPGSSVFHGGVATGPLAQARLNDDDRWPENDSLTLPEQPPPQLARWWIGAGSPPAGWRSLTATNLPADLTEYLAASVIALSNVSSTELSDTQQERIAQYVRDLGGSLLIFGGDHAFASGGYSGSQLALLSPLASDPPSPTTHWMLLADSSGSMAESSNGRSRWALAIEAMTRLIPFLPAKDIVSVGSFARDLSWWVDSQPAGITAHLAAPPPNILPNGPTNLEPVLSQIAKRSDPIPCELLLLTDADTTIENPSSLADALKAAKVRVSLLALGNISPDNPVLQIVRATGGHWAASDDRSQWVASLHQLMRSAAPSYLQTQDVELQLDPALGLPKRALNSWNRTWIKVDANQIASANLDHQEIALGARWQVGVGSVSALAFTPTPDEINAISNEQSPPRDPRFKVTWQCNRTIEVSIDTANETGYFNDLRFVLNLAGRPPQPLHQTGPGQYSLEIPALRQPDVATLQLDGHVIDRHAIAGRYAQEFEEVGNDDAALAKLASITNGQVISPTRHTPIAFDWPPRPVRLDSYFAAIGAILLAAGTILSISSYPMARSVR